MKKFLLVIAVLLGLLPASIAKAHDPIILTSDQRTPSDGPLLLDGTISFALYGSLDSAGDTRGFRVKFNAGDLLYLSILIPDLAPENTLDDASLPFLNVEDPSGAMLNFAITEKISFAEPYTGTNYVRLTEFTTTALSGTYLITVAGDSPARFTISVGKKEMFGTPVENITNRELGVAGVMAWYAGESTPEPETQSPATQTTLPEAMEQDEGSENNRSLVLITILIAAIIAVAITVKVSKKRNKNEQ
ncbi:MAG: hypothetical protein O3B17_07165 [Actinomycetota bacterium]|nr:hypothetical protein [Actinomycetota bacterium]